MKKGQSLINKKVVVVSHQAPSRSKPKKPIATQKRAVPSQKIVKVSQNKAKVPKKPINWRKLRRGVIIVGLVIIVLGLGYGLFCSNYFRVRDIEISGTEFLSAPEIHDRALTALTGPVWQLWRVNFWLTTSRRVCRNLEDYQLIGCRVRRHWPNKLTLVVTEEPPVAIWQEGSRYYLVDQFGRIIKEDSAVNASSWPVIQNQGDTLANDNKVAANPALWTMILAIKNSQWPNGEPHNFIFNNNEPNSLRVIGTQGQIIKLNLRHDLESQLALWRMGQSKFSTQLSEAKIIDLRYGDRIIYQ